MVAFATQVSRCQWPVAKKYKFAFLKTKNWKLLHHNSFHLLGFHINNADDFRD